MAMLFFDLCFISQSKFLQHFSPIACPIPSFWTHLLFVEVLHHYLLEGFPSAISFGLHVSASMDFELPASHNMLGVNSFTCLM